MSDPRILETEIGTPTPLRGSLRRGDLPEDLLRDASRRLGIVGLVGAGLWGAEIVLLHLVTSMPSLVPPDQAYLLPKTLAVYDGVALTNILVSLGLFWYTRHSGRSQTFLLDLGLGYEVFIALSIGLLDYAGPGPQGLS